MPSIRGVSTHWRMPSTRGVSAHWRMLSIKLLSQVTTTKISHFATGTGEATELSIAMSERASLTMTTTSLIKHA
uniref:Putative ovule protein n=1 Tax=Solanum chacoense TaxID=4108 RepID=A0A0V0GKV0_SOLCH